MISLLFLGDIVGRTGRDALKKQLAALKSSYNPDCIIANGENAAGGTGLDIKTSREILDYGVDIITGGNHSWSKRELIKAVEDGRLPIIVPANYFKAPIGGVCIRELPGGLKLGVLNLIGRIFMGELVDCPFQTADRYLSNELAGCDLVLVDFHAEATSEKAALAYYLAGRVTAVLGTHTHVQTADEQIIKNHTAFISDVGMCGPQESILGVEVAPVVDKFRYGRPFRFEVAAGVAQLNGVVIHCEQVAGRFKAVGIERICKRDIA